MKFLIFFIFFILIGAFFIISNENIHMNNQDNIILFLKSYGSWISKLTHNTISMTGNMIKMNWLPE